jgi:hypothetical protein
MKSINYRKQQDCRKLKQAMEARREKRIGRG